MIIPTLFLAFIFMTHFINPIFSENKPVKVVVVGAGISGLTTALRLQQAGIDVEVYEARPRVGGRIFTVKTGQFIGELGGMNIYDGGEAEHIHELVEEFGLELQEATFSFDRLYCCEEKFISVQKLLGEKKYDPIELRKKLEKLASTSRNMKEVLGGILNENEPLYKVIAVRLAAYEGGTLEQLSPYYAETLYHMLLGRISAVHQEEDHGKHVVNFLGIKGGNGLLCTKISEKLGDRIHLNKPLAHVEKNSEGFILKFKIGEEKRADILVLTIPCSVYENITFANNVITEERLKTIRSIHYGENSKILVPFTTLSEDKSFINDDIVSFFGVDHRLLTLFYTGKSSFFTPNTIVNSYARERALIEKVFKEDAPKYKAPVYAEDRAFVAYDGPVGFSWPNDPYARGSYAYVGPGQEALFTDTVEVFGEEVRALFAPIENKLFFAGEHTSMLEDIPGTMEAACESGERTARLIIKSFPSKRE